MIPALSVIGMGNPGMSDDGVGMRVVEQLARMRESGAWDGDADIIAGGADATLVAASLAEGRRVHLVDAVDMGEAPGAWRMLTPEEVAPQAVRPSQGSTHALPLAEAVELARSLGCAAGLRILGIQAGNVNPGDELTPAVHACLPLVLQRIREEIEVAS